MTRTVRKTSGSQSSRHRTSDYSSEEGENEISSSRNIENESSKNFDTHTSKSSNGQAKTAFQVYKEAGEYWK